MTYFPKRPYYIGITPEKSMLKIAILKRGRLGWCVKQLKEMSYTSSVKLLDTLSHEGRVTTTLPGQQVLIRPLDFPLKKEKDLKSALQFHAQNVLPYPVQEAVIDAKIIGSVDGKTRLNLMAIRQNHLQNHLQWCAKHQIEPEVTTGSPISLAALSTALTTSKAPQLMVHVGFSETCVTLVKEGHILKSFAFSSDLPLPTQIRKVTLALFQSGRAHLFDAILLFGNVTEETRALIEEVTGKPALFPSSDTLNISQEKLIEFGLAIGTALASSDSINFLKDSFTPKQTFKKYKRPLALFGAASLMLASLFTVWGMSELANKKKEIQKQFDTLLVQEGRERLTVDKPAEYLSVLQDVKEGIEARFDTYALHPLVPNVSEFLSWFSNHPFISKNKAVTIQSARYLLVSHPDLTHPKERYKVKITLELKTANSGVAKLLHEALSNDETYVDLRQPIQWSTAKDGSHHVSFFLKDKTRYT